ncbi:helix-turn-helix domain-containing protein [Streptomyces sp. HD]|uniref:helix-turn-helix domain-containing protein n=1 Tax=Streptomyces sp. HD TaxID=3020892 RepID=UPI00232B3138|nr:helix-turn-helix transcriptional regulator [Streptomyces sp. HD]MDC0769561.1 helix-turn-helix transcriptional regulator [Streptomyces sp. HD]
MSGATEAGEAEAFARLLRDLKDRSGLSYGALAKRLHMSTSTLHRYCNGTAVPVDYAPVERLARVCRATPQELVELHRHWILADAARGRGTDQAAATRSAQDKDRDKDKREDKRENESESGEPVVVDLPDPLTQPRRPARLLRRRTALIASVATAAVLGAVALAVGVPFDGGGKDEGPAGQADSAVEATAGGARTGTPSAAPSASGKGKKPSSSPSASPTRSAGAGSAASAGGGGQEADRPVGDGASDAVPLTVDVRPYVYDSPCSQHFLVKNEPEQVGPPASEQDAQRWATAYGAISSNEQRIALTVQGTGKETVVLKDLHVRVLSKSAPPGWNEYAMGSGCGGGVQSRSFDVDLDSGSPTVTVKNGQRDFPYKVSESDPEVYYVTVHTTASDVRWDLTLDWSSGSRRGTVHIDNDGTPFHTSARVGGKEYSYPLGGSEWIETTGS